jgi:type II secretory pathway predicted ATPase ExeA
MAGVYEAFYRLSSDPFRLSPDHRFSYAHPSYRKARACMQYALRRGQGFLVMTGTPGTGKTTLIEDVCAQIDDARITLVSLLSTRLQPDDLLDMVAMGLGVGCNEADSPALRSEIETALLRQRRSQRRVVLMVDEAQDLSAAALEALRRLSDMRPGSRQLVQVFLVGQDPLVELIERPDMEQVRQRIVAAAHLRPLSCEDTTAFVIYRLQRAGWQGDPGITPQALASVYEFSRGVPRLINQLGSRLLFLGAVERKHSLDGGDVDRVIDGLREEMAFGGAVAQTLRDRRRHAPEGEPAMYERARAGPAVFALPERLVQPHARAVALSASLDTDPEGSEEVRNPAVPALAREGQGPTESASACQRARDNRTTPEPARVACAAVPRLASLSGALPVRRNARVAASGAAREARRERRVFPVKPRSVTGLRRQVPFAVLLAAFAAIGYQLRSSGNLAVREPLPQVSGEMAAFTVVPVPGSERSPAAAAYGDSPGWSQAAAAGKAAAARDVVMPVRVLGTAGPEEPSMGAPQPVAQSATLKGQPAKASLQAGVSGFGVANTQYRPEEVQAWLMSGHWARYGAPAARLPSPVTRCRSRADHIVCWSAPQKIAAGSRDGIYQVQATLEDFSSDGSFRVRYRVMESTLRVKDAEPAAAVRTKAGAGPAARAQKPACTVIDSTLIRCAGEVDAVFRLGWKVAGQDTTCRAITGGLVRCRGGMEGVFRLGWKLSEAEMTCRAIDSSLIRCRDDDEGVYVYRSSH